ncbi:MAG: response regulator [Bacteroidota bacterium]
MTATLANKKPLIFIVEDNLAYRVLLARMLEKRGYMVMLFQNGKEALDMLAYSKPDVILSDIEMPRMNGFDLFDNVKKVYPKSQIPFLYLSSSQSSETITEAFRRSKNEMLGKPVDLEDLYNQLENTVVKKKTA